jgi:TonB family protein
MNGMGNRRHKAGRYPLGLLLAGTAAFAQTPSETSATSPSSVGAPVRTHVRMDSTHHPILGEEYYPKDSVRLGETGKCIMRAQVDADGGIRAFQLLSSSGFARLDQACFASLIDARLIPATVDGKPVASWDLIPLTWSLNTRPPVPDKHPDLSSIPQVKQDFRLKVGPDFYPSESRKRQEKGICVVHVYVAADGSPSNVTLTQSAGFDALDLACRSAVHEAQFDPGKENGVPVGAATDIIIIWQPHEKPVLTSIPFRKG